MQLGIRRPIVKSWPTGLTSEATQTLASGENLIEAMIADQRGNLFALCDTSPAKLLKWSSPSTDLSTYSVLTFPADANHVLQTGAAQLAYNPNDDRLYMGFVPVGAGGHNFNFKVARVNPVDLSYTDLAGSYSSLDPSQEALKVVTDGTYLYCFNQNVDDPFDGGAAGVVQRLKCTNGTLLASTTLSNGKARNHTQVYDRATSRIYMGGESSGIASSTGRWVGYISTDFATQADVTGLVRVVTDDSAVVVNGDYWVGTEFVSGGVRRYSSDLSRVNTYVYRTGLTECVYYDGTVLWIGYDVGTNVVDCIDLNGNLLFSHTLSTGFDCEEAQRIGNKLYCTTFASPAKIERLAINF